MHSPTDPRETALELIGHSLAERDPHALAMRVAALLMRECGGALCGLCYRDGDENCAVVATSLSEPATAIHLHRIFPLRPPERLSIFRVIGGASSGGLRDGAWRREGGAEVRVFWVGRAVGLTRVLEIVGDALAVAIERAVEIRALQRAATIDPLTDLANRRGFWTALARECARATRYGVPLAVAMCDLDDFASINDRFGHLEGDRVLRDVARALRRGVRAADLVARLGGDEMAIILPETDERRARATADRLRRIIHGISAGGNPVGASIGVAEFGAAASTPVGLVDAADRAMYAVKRAGGRDLTAAPPLRKAA